MGTENETVRVSLYPMHGYTKMRTEGFRTRDSHMLEWIARLSPTTVIDVYSRPDPVGMRTFTLARSQPRPLAAGTTDLYRDVWRVPPLKDRKRWWINSAAFYNVPTVSDATLVWNPALSLAPWFRDQRKRLGHVHFDLLDDWLVHHAFRGIRADVARAYGLLFEVADSVSANSESTLALAHRHGRTDANLIPNGCDPNEFKKESTARGATTLGYIGKIGNRLDVALVRETSKAFPNWNLVFAGPVLDKEVGHDLASLPNVQMTGDVAYERIPELLQTFDIGWVPHDVANGQVGGDAIKIYEYRAAALPVLTTPIIGTRERPMDGVFVIDAEKQPAWLKTLPRDADRVGRIPGRIGTELTWRAKTLTVLETMGLV